MNTSQDSRPILRVLRESCRLLRFTRVGKVIRKESRDKSGWYVRERRWKVTFAWRPPGNDVSNEHRGAGGRDAPAPNSVETSKYWPRGRERPASTRLTCTHACLWDDKFVIANLYNWQAGSYAIRHWGPTNLWLMSHPPLPYVFPSALTRSVKK